MADNVEFNLDKYSDELLNSLIATVDTAEVVEDVDLAQALGISQNDDEGLPDLLSIASQVIGLTDEELGQLLPTPTSSNQDPFLFEASLVARPRHTSLRTTSRSSDEGIVLSPTADNTSESDSVDVLEVVDELPDSSILQLNQDTTTNKSNNLTSVAKLVEVTDETGRDDAKCFVCKEKAGKHSYYGGRVCPSCRAFFRRAVQSKYYEIFFCTKGEKCDINLKTRRSCQYCRFKKCLESGMRIAWVLPDGERNRRFNKLNKVKERNSLASSNRAVTPMIRGPILTVTNEELHEINNAHEVLKQSGHLSMEEYLNSNPSFFKDLAAASYFGGKMSFEFFRHFNGMCAKVNKELFMAMDEFRQLPITDRKVLIEINGNIMNRFKSSVCIQEVNSCLANGIETATKSGKYPALNEISERLQALKFNNRKPLFAYHQFFASPWAANYEDERRHFQLMQLMKAWPRDNIDSPVDDIQVTLMKVIIAFSPDFIQLERRDLVEKVQLRYTWLLQRYLKFRYGSDANRRFVNGLMMASYARETNDIHERKALHV